MRHSIYRKALWTAAGCLFMALAAVEPRAASQPLEIWISSFQDKIYYEKMVRLYQEKVDQDFTATIRAYGFREMPDKLAVAIKTGVNPPDIVQLDEVLFGTYLSGETPFIDLTDRVKKAGLTESILPQRLSLFSYGGKCFGLPQSLSAMVLYYRTDLFEKHGIRAHELATWDGFLRVGERLAEEDQALIGLDPTYFDVLLRQRGSDWFGKDGQTFPDPELAVDTLEFLKKLQDKGIGMMPDRSSIFDPVFFNSAVLYGEILCIMGADWYGLDMIQQFTPELKGKWGILPLPAWVKPNGNYSPRTSTFAGQGLLIYKASGKVEPAWKFIEFVMTDTEANVERFVQGNSFPAYMPAWKDERLLQPSEFFNNQPFGRILINLSSELPEVVTHPKRPQAIFLFQESFFSTFMHGQLTARQTLNRLKEYLDRP